MSEVRPDREVMSPVFSFMELRTKNEQKDMTT